MDNILKCSKIDAKKYVDLTEQHINGKICYCAKPTLELNENM